MTLGKRIKQAMESKNMKQYELAEKTYITQTTISRYVTDERTPDAITLKAICEALDVSADWLLEIREEQQEELKRLEELKKIEELKRLEELKKILETVAQIGGTVQASYVLSILED